jgi:FkbH-like protein
MGTLLAAVHEAEESDKAWRENASVHVLRNYTTEPLDPYLKFHLLRDDIRPTISHGGYGTIVQELIDEDSPIVTTPPDLIVLSLLIEFLDPTVSDEDWSADTAILEITSFFNILCDRTSAFVVANTLLPPIDLLHAGLSANTSGELDRLNEHLLDLANRHKKRVVVCDWRNLPVPGGLESAIDKRFWRSSEAPFRGPFLDLYARRIAGCVRAIKGLAKKCLILDCDNTLWGGVIGEDGMDGIELDDKTEPGASFHRFQREVIKLHDKGVMVAICSKNNEDDVWNVFDGHRHSVLKKDHLVAWRINWDNKAGNIASIVDELNIGLDSVVFVDDNPRELALIADRLPDVTLIAVPEDLSCYPLTLTKDRFFETLSASDEDRKRTRMYQQQNARSDEQQHFSDLSDYLRSLQTVVQISRADEPCIGRVAQLTQKTNQFNLTTRRYTEAQMRSFASDPQMAVFRMSVTDRFGDMGITGVFVARLDGATAIVDSVLLSCRVLGRRLEIAFVDQCMQSLEACWPISKWRAEYIATPKNQQTAEFWDGIGFKVVQSDDSSKLYESDVCSRIVDYLKIMTVESE